MRGFTLVAALGPLVLAQTDDPQLPTYNPRLCGGVGGCPETSRNNPPRRPWRCSDGSMINVPELGSVIYGFTNDTYDIITMGEFPAKCQTDARPGEKDILVRAQVVPGVRAYAFISGECGDRTKPVTSDICYADWPNPHVTTLCNLQDSTGASCEVQMDAGRCEFYGTLGGPECATWTPDQVEEKCIDLSVGRTRCG